jgi:hypothetical protein
MNIKNTIATLAGITLISTGCGTFTPDQCKNLTAVYAAYQATLAEGRPVSDEERMAALAAATYLTTQCGWVATPEVVVAQRGVEPRVDNQGVPIIERP